MDKNKTFNTILIISAVLIAVISLWKFFKSHESYQSSTCPQGDDALINVDSCRHLLGEYFGLVDLTYLNAAGVFYQSFNKIVPDWRKDPYFDALLKTWHSVVPVIASIHKKDQNLISAKIKILLANMTNFKSLYPTNPDLVKIISNNEALQATISGLWDITDDLLTNNPWSVSGRKEPYKSKFGLKIPCPWNPDEWCVGGNCPQWMAQLGAKNPCTCSDDGQTCSSCSDQGCWMCDNVPGGNCSFLYGKSK
jgi:hypothetical protein